MCILGDSIRRGRREGGSIGEVVGFVSRPVTCWYRDSLKGKGALEEDEENR